MKSTAVLQVDFMLNECLKVMVSIGQNFLLWLCWILETLRKVSVKLKMLVMVMFDRRRYKNLRWSVFHSQSYFWNTYASFLQYCCPWSRRSRHCICSLWLLVNEEFYCSVSHALDQLIVYLAFLRHSRAEPAGRICLRPCIWRIWFFHTMGPWWKASSLTS